MHTAPMAAAMRPTQMAGEGSASRRTCADPMCNAEGTWVLPAGATSRNPDAELVMCESCLDGFLARLLDFDGFFAVHKARKAVVPLRAALKPAQGIGEAIRKLRQVLDDMERRDGLS